MATEQAQLTEIAVAVGRRMRLSWTEFCELEQVATLADLEIELVASVTEFSHLLPTIEAIDLRWDDGLRGGESIPVVARIVAASRAFVDLACGGAYALGPAATVDTLRAWAGSRFCPRVVRSLIAEANLGLLQIAA